VTTTVVGVRDEALTRIVKVMTMALGAIGLVYGFLTLPGILRQSASIAAWWAWPMVLLTFVLPFVAGVIARWSALRVLRLLAGTVAVGFLAAMLSLKVALAGGYLPLDLGAPGILGVSALASIAAAIAWRPKFVWPYVGLIALLVGVDRVLASPQPILDVASQDALVALFMDTFFTALALVTIRAGQLLDQAAMFAIDEATRAAALRAEDRERSRAEALVHDVVLATLIAASKDDPQLRSAAAVQAQSAIRQLESFREDASTVSDLSATDIVWRIQATTTDTAPQARFGYDLESKLTVPDEVARALSEATAEALRNSLRHGNRDDRPVNRSVHVGITDDGIQVNVIDDGRGFDPTSISPSRLGIATSIKRRLMSLSGGRAAIVSEIGQGTRIFLEWQRS
jgi:signal transduction histidine kinase